MIQRILAVAAGLLVVLAVSGWGHEQHPTDPGQTGAAGAIRALSTDAPNAVNRIPADFRSVMGYQPALVQVAGQDEPSRSDGGCSSPFGGTPFHFSTDCQQHDLGYDLLRYAKDRGQPLGPWARKAVDVRFARQLHAQCGHRTACGLVADLYSAVVRFNSWRQGYGAPVVEPLARFVVPLGAGLGTALFIGVLPWFAGTRFASSLGRFLGVLPWPRRRIRPVLAQRST